VQFHDMHLAYSFPYRLIARWRDIDRLVRDKTDAFETPAPQTR
jgi:hypothetical protein